MIYTDSHAHLSSVAEEFGAEGLASILRDYEAAQGQAEIERRTPPLLLDPGTEPEDLSPRVALLDPASRREYLRMAAGVWPSPENLASPASSLRRLEGAIGDARAAGVRVAAIGEGGLDYHYEDGISGGLKAAQAELFEGQLRLASRLALPMIVHTRDAAADTLSILRAARPSSPVLVHCFGYGAAEARAFLDLGCWISFAGNLTYKKSEGLRTACALVPADRLLLETDSTYMNPMPLRGKSSSPRDVERTYAFAASLRGVTLADLMETVSRNARRLFG
jgi:TatD DNase family protein